MRLISSVPLGDLGARLVATEGGLSVLRELAVDLSGGSGGASSMSAPPESIRVCTSHAGGLHHSSFDAGGSCNSLVGLALVPVACRLRCRYLTFGLKESDP